MLSILVINTENEVGVFKDINSGATGLGQSTAQNIFPRVQEKVKCTALIRPGRGCMIICKRGEQRVLSR